MNKARYPQLSRSLASLSSPIHRLAKLATRIAYSQLSSSFPSLGSPIQWLAKLVTRIAYSQPSSSLTSLSSPIHRLAKLVTKMSCLRNASRRPKKSKDSVKIGQWNRCKRRRQSITRLLKMQYKLTNLKLATSHARGIGCLRLWISISRILCS